MLRLLVRSALPRRPWPSSQRLYATGVFLGLSGSLYYTTTSRTIHADNKDVPTSDDESQGNQDPKSYSEHSGPHPIPILESVAVRSNVDILREAATSYFPEGDVGISRLDSIVVPSNNPPEDYLSSVFCHLPSHAWSLFGVFDGHNGPQTSAWLAHNLIAAIVGSLADLFSKHEPIPEEHSELETGTISGRPYPPPEAIDDTIKDTFRRVDDDIVNGAVERAFAAPSKEAAINLLGPAHAGSCALLAFYESDIRSLRVAVTGDSRAVLGRRTKNDLGQDSYEVHVLSADQNAHNAAEEARMSSLHPGEKIMEKGRVLGWGMSRAFGDAAYKWSREVQERLNKEYLGDRLPQNVKTPPYFTAEPEITTTEVQPGDFLVLASDGLWDCLTNEEVVGLVGLWMSKYKNPLDRRNIVRNTKSHSLDQVIERDELPVKMKEDKTVMYSWWRTPKRFINVDDNVASHLARNALGGADRDLTAALLSMTPPRSRRYRDDVGVTVVFFDEN